MSQKDPEIPIDEMPVEEPAPKRVRRGASGLDISPEAVKARKKALRESRIEQIMALMRPVVTKAGKPSWDSKIEHALQASWRLPGRNMRYLAEAASKRLVKEMIGQEGAAAVQRNLALTSNSAIISTFHSKDWKSYAAVANVGIQLLKAPATEVTVTVRKAPTPVDAAAAVAEMFGKRVTNDSSTPVDGTGEEPADGSGSEGSSPEA